MLEEVECTQQVLTYSKLQSHPELIHDSDCTPNTLRLYFLTGHIDPEPVPALSVAKLSCSWKELYNVCMFTLRLDLFETISRKFLIDFVIRRDFISPR